MFTPPMGHPSLTLDGHYMPEAIAYYEYRAKGGAASVCCSEANVHTLAWSHARAIDLSDDYTIQSLTQAARAIKKHGAAATMEISHGGKFAGIELKGKAAEGFVHYGPSACTLPNGAQAEEMPVAMIRGIIDWFGKGAARLKLAGFDMIVLHAGHGWLIHQFLNSADNQRTDEYGGDLKKRTRILHEILEAMRGAVGRDYPIEIRISAEDYLPGGNSFEDTIEICKAIEDKVNLLQISNGSYIGSFDKTHPSMFDPRGINVHYAAAVKQQVKVPVSTLGALCDPEMMEDIIKSGKADVVELARASLADPQIPHKIMTGRENEIRKCIRCFTCLSERVPNKTRFCAVNPAIGRELENLRAVPPTTPKKVFIAGGGPGGMQCAVKAAERGHDVTLYEKNEKLGGALLSESKVDFKADFVDLARILEIEMNNNNVKILKGTELTPEICEAEKPDVVVIAVGANAIMPKIPGIESPKVVSANRLSDDDVQIGSSVAIMGGGLVGCEAAVHLASEGKKVTIIEMMDGVARDVGGLQYPILMRRLAEVGVEILVNTKGLEVNDEGLKVELEDGTEKTIPAETVMIAVGQSPNAEAREKLRNAAPIVEVVGDCIKPGKVTEALSRGWYAGIDI
jgi:2,4-dienoyl-CoA reductase-like NADH-dependent reductase (Old Yellow Enzyme family)/thioredoxin reductase